MSPPIDERNEPDGVLGLGLSAEQRDLRRELRSYLATHCSEEQARACMRPDVGWDERLWHGLARDLGGHGLGIPERLGGSGGSLVDQGVLFEQLGSWLAVVPAFGTLAAAGPLLRQLEETTASAALLSEIAAGRVRAAVVWDAAVGCAGAGAAVRLSVAPDGRSGTVHGRADHITDGHVADVLLVVAPGGEDELDVALVRADAAGVSRTSLPTTDQTRGQAAFRFGAADAQVLARSARAAVLAALAQTTALLAMEQVGIGQRLLDGTNDYAKVRTQFGAAIGSFQAVRHRIVDMLQDVEASRSAALYALFSSSALANDMLAAASAAKSFCSDAGIRVAESAVQVHGAIGLTWEHWVHLYLKRAWSTATLLGSASQHRERLAGLVGL